MLRHITRPFLFSKTATRNTAVEQKTAAGQQKIRKWLQRLNQVATTPASRSAVGQLTTVVNFLNRKVSDQTKQIDWKGWSDKIITPGLVSKVQANYQELMKQQYDLDRITNQVFNTQSKALQKIGRQMDFHTAVWLDNYSDYVQFLFSLQEFPGMMNMSVVETFDKFAAIEERSEALIETHNYLPGAKDDVDLATYIQVQFAWGKKVISFYKHPADDFKCSRSTKNVLGR